MPCWKCDGIMAAAAFPLKVTQLKVDFLQLLRRLKDESIYNDCCRFNKRKDHQKAAGTTYSGCQGEAKASWRPVIAFHLCTVLPPWCAPTVLQGQGTAGEAAPHFSHQLSRVYFKNACYKEATATNIQTRLPNLGLELNEGLCLFMRKEGKATVPKPSFMNDMIFKKMTATTSG